MHPFSYLLFDSQHNKLFAQQQKVLISDYFMVHTFSFVIQQPLFNLHPS